MRRIFILCGVIAVIIVIVIAYQHKRERDVALLEKQRIERELQAQKERQAEQLIIEKRLKDKAAEALIYAKQNGFDLKHAVLIDFNIHSGKKRFFVWNYETDSAEFSSLVAHGYGNDNYRSTTTKIIFSNVNGSYASSLGKYKIGIRSYSQWGINIHYKLHGLEKTNDNAYKRVIVLHSYEYIPESELYPLNLPLGYSQGCPVIDNSSMKKIDSLMKTKSKPVLLWIYQ